MRTDTTAASGGHGGSRAGGGSARGAHGPAGVGPWPWIGGGVMLAVALAVGAGVARRTRSRRDPLAELERALARTGRPLRAGVTLAALETRFQDSPEAAGYIRALRLSRYGAGDGRNAADGTPTAAGRRALRAQLRAELGPAGWLRALWALPPRPPRPSV